jgi:hypothetical protein
MASADDEFHDFASGFSDPLTRLAFLLLAGVDAHAQRAAIEALAHTRQRWRDVRATGAPESVAVEALLVRLPRRGWRWRHREVVTRFGDVDPATETDKRAASDGVASGDVVTRMREAVWSAWSRLHPRERVPLLFADLTVVSRRLDGVDLPEAFASPRRLHALEAVALADLDESLARGAAKSPDLARAFRGLGDTGIGPLLADVLREKSAASAPLVDPYPSVIRSAKRARARVGVAAAAVLSGLVGAGVVIANVSSSGAKTGAASRTAGSSALIGDAPSIRVAPAPESRACRSYDGNVEPGVGWPLRTYLPPDAVQAVVTYALTSFKAAHPQESSSAQVLVAADASWLRVVLVVSNSSSGPMATWFYAAPGATAVREGARTPLTAHFDDNGVVAEVLVDENGHSELVVVGSPLTTRVQLANLFIVSSFSANSDVPFDDGVTIADVSGVPSSALLLRVSMGDAVGWDGRVPDVVLAGSTGTAAPRSQPPPVPQYVHGHPDPVLLQGAVVYLHDLIHGGVVPETSGPVSVWGATDSGGTELVVMHGDGTGSNGFAVVVWSGHGVTDRSAVLLPGGDGLAFAFEYTATDGARVGVVAELGVAYAGLVVDGVDLGEMPVGSDGFASLRVGDQHGTLAGRTLAVDLFDASDHQLARLAVPPNA